MKLAKARFVDADRNGLYGAAAVALSVFVFAYSAVFGQVSILAYYAVWFPLVAIDYRHALGNYSRYFWILAFGAMALLSTFWSDAFSVSLRAGIQYLTHLVCALIAARTISIMTLSRGALFGIAAVVLFSLADGSYQYDAIDGTYSLVGAFSSKNQLGFYASLGVYFAVTSLLILRERGLWRVPPVCVGLISAFALVSSQSATSMISVLAALLVAFAFFVFLFFSPKQRKATFSVGVIVALALVPVAVNGGFLDVILGVFGKDSTLTGRTYLWAQGMMAADVAPILGVGYQAYWVQGFSEAERLWYEFFITGRAGFHFHNTFIEVFVELGLVGVALLSLVFVTTLAGHVKRLLAERRNAVSHVLIGLLAMLFVRSFFEIDVITPYAIGSFLLYYAAGLLSTRQERARNVVPTMAAGALARPG